MKTKIVQKQFKRVESKYVINKEVFAALEADLADYMVHDDFAQSTITNIYFDTADFDMIQDAIARKYGREKVRMRTYKADPNADSEAFLEIKQKKNEIGYKYRLTATPAAIIPYMTEDKEHPAIDDEKVMEEMAVLKERYGKLQPMMYIYYDRVSYKAKDIKGLRLTLDQNLLCRDSEVKLEAGKFGQELLPQDKMIMEIKSNGTLPEWLEAILAKYDIVETGFSKYSNAFSITQGVPLPPKVQD